MTQTARTYTLRRPQEFAFADVGPKYAPDLGLVPVHTKIQLQVDPLAESAVGTVWITVKAEVPDQRQLTLDAVDFQNLNVTDETAHELHFRYDGDQIALRWEKAFAEGEERIIQVEYKVVKPLTGLLFSHPLETLPDAPLFAVTDNETERARYWFPCVDFLTVRTTLEFLLTAPRDLTILANGNRISEEVAGEWKTAHWKLDYPCPSYLACFAIGDFTQVEDEPLRDIPIQYFADRSYTPEQVRRTFDQTRPMLKWMEKKLGQPYPFPKYFQFAALGIGGAMENISLVSWDDKVMLDETMARELKYHVDLVNVHEMAHTYFGDAIVSYDFAHVWLKESWATYIESVWLEDTVGQEAMDWQLAEEARTYMAEVKDRYVRPIVTRDYDHSWNMFDMHLYPGGAWRLHMLRHEVGTPSFWAGVRDYVAKYMGKTVETIDFQRCLERRSGRNLGPFFDQWFHASGYPVLKLDFEYDGDRSIGVFTLEQKQVDAKRKIPVFNFDLEIEWRGASGEIRTESLQIRKEKQVFLVPMEEPETLIADPGLHLLAEIEFDPGSDRLRRLLDPELSVSARMQAITALCSKGRTGDLEAIATYLSKEKFWGLRCHTYRQLSSVGTPESFGIIGELLEGESDDMALEHAAKAAGSHAAPRLRAAILEKLKEQELPYFARRELLHSLGKQRQAEDLPYLSEAMQREDWRKITAAGASLGLAALRTPQAVLPLTREAGEETLFHDERVARYQGAANLYRWLDPAQRLPLLDMLVNGTRDRLQYAALAAARALPATGEAEARNALQAYRRRRAPQEWPVIDRLLQALEDASKPSDPGKKFSGKLEKLDRKLGEFENRLQKLEAANKQ